MVDKIFADTALVNGKVVTLDSKDRIVEAVALKDGKIVKVGTSEDINAFIGEKTKIIDIQNKVVLPGLIDTHVHIDGFAAHTKLIVNCRIPPNNSVEEIKEKIRKKVQETPRGEWIIAQGRFEVQPYPTKKELDDLAPENPVVIRYNGHRSLANTKALEMAEGGRITKDSPTEEELQKLSPGGRIQRDPVTREPTGITDDCWDYIFRRCPYPYEQLKEVIQETCKELVQFGITSVHELTSWSESTRIYQELLRDGKLPLRMQLIPCVWGLHRSTDLDSVLELGLQTSFGNERLKFGGVKIYVDGGNPPEYITERMTSEELNNMVVKAHKAGIRILMHAVYRKGTKMAIDAVEAALKEKPNKDHRHRIEHFGSFNPVDLEDIERLESLGIIPCPQPFIAFYGALDDGAPYTYGSLIRRGLRVPGSSDCVGTAPESINPWWSMWCALSRKNYKGELINPEEKVSIMEAIRAYTVNSAYAGFEEKIKGSIEEGKLADLIVLAEDPFTIPMESLKNMKVEMTIVDGQVVYSRK